MEVAPAVAAGDPAALPSRGSTHWSLQPLRTAAELEAEIWARYRDVGRGPTGGSGAKATAGGMRAARRLTTTNTLDAFLLVRLATNGLTFSPRADRATLVRRLSFDLIGLPPTPEAVDGYVGDSSADATERLAERLLASPQYGERWGRHWLDVARYTESQGFEYDRLRDNAWHYRDYVIRSFNEDKPYDRFMQEQVAGDVLEPVTSDGMIGASLLVCGPWDEAGNSQANQTQRAITREEELEDVVGTVGQTFLGLTLNCARCHAHKFDPIPQEEYYRVKAVFEGVKHGERAYAGKSEVRAREDQIAALKRDLADARESVTRLESAGASAAAAQRQPGGRAAAVAAPGPVPYLRWDFGPAGAASTGGRLPFELQGGAILRDGRLQLPSPGAGLRTGPLSKDIREKTLEAWVALDRLDQGGGAALSIESEDGGVFDAIVYGEREAGKWMAGSNGFERTRDLDAPAETAGPQELVHLAIVYRPDNSIAVYRNGQPYGKEYRPASPLPTYRAGHARLLVGQRHTGGGRPWMTGAVRLAALHDRALSPAEVAASFQAGGDIPSLEEALLALTATQRVEREAALERVRTAQAALDAVRPLPVSYVGTRVQPAATRVLRRGDVKSPGDVVTPAALSAVTALEPNFRLTADAPEAERRLAFARWLADSRNPLPARVMANRIWQFHFGQGLVATPNDFGVSGARPTHPELLDWLAAKLIESGWRVKSLHRLIVNSLAYQQASSETTGAGGDDALSGEPDQAPAAWRRALEVDADDQLLWHFPGRRLEAEAVRDAVLAVSGQLNPAMGGPSFRPFDAMKFPANAYVPADKIGPDFNRRTVYRMNVNSGKEPLLDAFDCPDPAVKTPRRGVTTTPLQALALMNHSFVQRNAGHLADISLREAKGELAGAIQEAYRHALGRRPTADEAARALAAAQARSLTNVCWALLNSSEFVYMR